MIRDTLSTAIGAALDAVARDRGLDPSSLAGIGLERPARPEHGDWSSNVAMVAAKSLGTNPRDLATALTERLAEAEIDHVVGVEVAGPGFVNFRLADSWLHDVLAEVVARGQQGYARHDFGAGTRVNVEFVSANPNKPLHAGHGRGACLGDSVARLFERCGFDVTRESYLNDRGVQMQLFAESLAARSRGDEPPDDGYMGDYVVEWAAEMPADADPLEWGYDRALRSHRDTLERLGIAFDVWFSERSMVGNGAIDAALADLRQHGVVYEADGAVWLRSTDFGDDKDRVLVKSDGDATYLLPDIAYHRDKFTRAERLVNVWGADHHGYVSRLKAAMQALGHDPDELDIVITQLVDLERDGEQVRMAGRSGDLITIDDLLDEVGADPFRFTYLMQSADSRQTIDLGLITKTSMDNPVFYVQYAHARIASLSAKVAAAGITRLPIDEVDLSRLTHDRELDVLRALYELPDAVELACRDRAPHRITAWTRELATAFHGFYQDCRILGDDVEHEVSQARLWLVEAARIGLVTGLDLLGVSAPDSM